MKKFKTGVQQELLLCTSWTCFAQSKPRIESLKSYKNYKGKLKVYLI